MKSQHSVDIGNRLRQLRKSQEMTQEQIANEIDVSLRVWSDAENGHKGVTKSFLAKLQKRFDISVDYILNGEIPTNNDCPLIVLYKRCPPNKREKLVDTIESLVEFMS